MSRRAALRAEHRFRKNMTALNTRRGGDGRPTTSAYVGLHVGEVFYGNIGSDDRLDFTVVGPAVNEVSRIASMCRSVDRELLASRSSASASMLPAGAIWSPPAAGRCAASAARRTSTRSIPRVGTRPCGEVRAVSGELRREQGGRRTSALVRKPEARRTSRHVG